MKKFVSLAFCLIFILLCGCKKESSEVMAVTKGLSFNAVINFKEYSAEYSVLVDEQGNMKITVKEPQNIAGTVAEFSNGKIKINYNELEYTANISSMPQGLVTDFLYLVLSDAGSKSNEVITQNDEFYITGNTGQYNYKLFLGQTGLPIKITSQNGIEVTVKNASIFNQP